MATHNEFGKEAEVVACDFLLLKGYQILEKNWQFYKKEIDIIAFKNNTLIIVEVKARANNYFIDPQDAVNRKKQRNIITATNGYILQNEIDYPTRYDIISIVGKIGRHTIEHIEDAYIPML